MYALATAFGPFLPGAGRPEATSAFELRFKSLFQEGRALSFPCDEAGHVDVARLSRAGLTNYLYARACVGREFAAPVVVPVLPR